MYVQALAAISMLAHRLAKKKPFWQFLLNTLSRRYNANKALVPNPGNDRNDTTPAALWGGTCTSAILLEQTAIRHRTECWPHQKKTAQ